MAKIIDRIKQISDAKGISIRQMEIKIGASNGVINNALKKNTYIQSKWISKIIESFDDIDSNWLLTGNGDMIKCNNSIIETNNSSNKSCELCKEKEKRIEALERVIQTQADFINSLKNKGCSSSDEQKRKAG